MPKNTSITTQVARLVRREMKRNVEHKHYDQLQSGTAGIAGSGVLYLSSMAQGTTDITRIGDSITLDKLEVRFDLAYADNLNFARIIFFQWVGDAVTDVPAITDILESTPYYLSAYNWDQKGKYRILLDRSYCLDAVTSPRSVLDRATLAPPIKHQQFLSTSTNIEAGGLFAVVMTDSAAAAHPAYDIYSRVTYYDA